MAASLSTAKLATCLLALPLVAGHSFLAEPRSRNFVAWQQGTEFCPHCLQSGGPTLVSNRGDGVWPSKDAPQSHGLCGDPVQGVVLAANWRDETYLAPTSIQRTYLAGDIVEFHVGVSTHHEGHYEFRICDEAISKDLASREEGQDCLDTWVLERAPLREDCQPNDDDPDCQLLDEGHPERWYLPPRNSATQQAGPNWQDSDAPKHPAQSETHKMRYKIPAGLSCEHCTLQWYWASGNTCLYDGGYFTYFKKMAAAGWKVSDWCRYCGSGSESSICGNGKFAEEFWNCADIAIYKPGEQPTPAPTTSRTTSTTQAPENCSPVWGQCGGGSWTGASCCQPRSFCKKVDVQWYHQCVPGVAPTPQPTPTPRPTPAPQPTPTPRPTPAPTTYPTTSTSTSTTLSHQEPCGQLCGRSEATSCSELSDDEAACEEGYISKVGGAIPCAWTTCGCIADGEHLLSCSDPATFCERTEDPTPLPTAAPTTPAPTTPVARHGLLEVRGNVIVDQSGQPIRLRGSSLFWSQWMPQFYNAEAVAWLKNDWKVNMVRAAMGIEHEGYLTNPTTEKARVEAVVEAAIAEGIYVIIDWHDHNAEQHIDEAKEFFSEMAQKYGAHPNVLFEVFNEPVWQDWNSVIKPYHEQLVAVIREYSDNLIILGTRVWSQDVEEAARNPVSGMNLAYTIHFYASTHKQSLRSAAARALALNVPLFATEWGTCSASGDGQLDIEEAQSWLDFLEKNHISDANWAISDKEEACSALVPGVAATGGWTADQLTDSGAWVRASIRGA